MDKALQCLDGMMDANMELYEKILDTPIFAYHFGQLVKLAQSAAQPRAYCVGHNGSAFVKDGICQECGLPVHE
jgi:hypothetical protein